MNPTEGGRRDHEARAGERHGERRDEPGRETGRGQEPRGEHPGDQGRDGGRAAAGLRAGRGGSWLLPVVALVLLLALVAVGWVLWRSLGDETSGSETTRDSIDSGPSPRVVVQNGPGQVSVEGVRNARSVEYEATKHAVASDPSDARQRAASVPVDISREGGEVRLSTDAGRNAGADYLLRVPAGSTLEVESEAGDVGVRGLSGDVSVVAEAGDVSARDLGGSLTVEAPQGDVDVAGLRTDAGQVELTVGTGDLTLADLVVGTLEVGVEAGDVAISGRFSGGGRVSVGTGSILADLPPEDTRELDLEAKIGQVERRSPEGEDGNGGDGEGGPSD